MGKARSLAAGLLTLCLAVGAAFGNPGALEAKATDSGGLLLDVNFSKGTAANRIASGPQLIAGTGSTVTYEQDTTLGRKVAVFDEESGFGFQLDDAFFETLENGFTIEVLVRMDGDNGGQAVLGTDTGSAGFSIYNPPSGENAGGLHFWQRTTDPTSPRMIWFDGSNRKARPADGEWTHLLYSVNYSGTSYGYVNGERRDYVSNLGARLTPTGAAQVLYIGGNPDENGAFTAGLSGSIAFVKIYSSALDETKAVEAYQSAMSDDDDFDENHIVSRYAVMSDPHVREAMDRYQNKRFENALKAAKALTGGQLDAVLVAGDLIEGYGGAEVQISLVKDMLEANLDPDETEFIVATGNHEYYLLDGIASTKSWADYLGNEFIYQNPIAGNTDEELTRSNYHTVRNGIHIITVFGYDGNHQAADVAWLEEQLTIAANDTPTMPILVISHVPAAGSLLNDAPDAGESSSRWSSTTIVPVLEKFPQVVYMAGHTHATPDVQRYNDTFVAVGTGSLQDKQNMMILEVDVNGSVRIRNYLISEDSAETGDPLFETTFATPVAEATVPGDEPLSQTTVPEADVLDVDFVDGTAKDSVKNTSFDAAGQAPSIANNDAMDKNVADFNGTDTALVYQLSQEQFADMANGMTMELTVRLTETPESGETVLFGNEDFSLRYNSEGKLVFYAGDAELTSEKVDVGKWVHVSVVWNGSDFRLYVDGLRADVTRAGTFSSTTTALALGGITTGNEVENRTVMTVSNFRIYGAALDPTQAYALASRSLNTRMVFPDGVVFRVVKGANYTIPMPVASDANNDALEVSVSVADQYGATLTIRDGSFKSYNVGECIVTYRVNGLLVTKTVEVVKAGDASTVVVLDATEKTIAVGGSVTLKATASAVGEAITWISSDPSVASVDANGVVTGVKAGTAVITAVLDNGQTAACTVTVTANGDNDGKTDENTSNSPDTGETVSWVFGLAVLSLSAAALIFARKRTA